MDLMCGGTALLLILVAVLVAALLVGAVILLKLGVIAQYAGRREADDQEGQEYSLDQSHAPDPEGPAA
jgi:hypothetical protein